MTELFKYVNIINPVTKRALVDKKTGRPVSRRVRMSDEEVEAHLQEQAQAQAQQQEQP